MCRSHRFNLSLCRGFQSRVHLLPLKCTQFFRFFFDLPPCLQVNATLFEVFHQLKISQSWLKSSVFMSIKELTHGYLFFFLILYEIIFIWTMSSGKFEVLETQLAFEMSIFNPSLSRFGYVFPFYPRKPGPRFTFGFLLCASSRRKISPVFWQLG